MLLKFMRAFVVSMGIASVPVAVQAGVEQNHRPLSHELKKIKVMKIVVECPTSKKYKSLDAYKALAKRILGKNGIKLVEQNYRKKVDAVLNIQDESCAIGKYYANNSKFRYSGAEVKGKLSVTGNRKELLYSRDFKYVKKPDWEIDESYFRTEYEAPFDAAMGDFALKLYDMVAFIKGYDRPEFYGGILALKDDDWNINTYAAMVLGDTRDPRAVEPIFSAARNNKVKSIDAKDALASIGTPAVESIIRALKDKNTNVRESAAMALELIRDPRALEPLAHASNDHDHNVRILSVRALGATREALRSAAKKREVVPVPPAKAERYVRIEELYAQLRPLSSFFGEAEKGRQVFPETSPTVR
jgi:hypothetical protein